MSVRWVAAGAAAAVVGATVYAAGRASMRPALVTARLAAATDPLTGVANRAGLLAELERRCRARQRYAVLLVDLDDFKTVNDLHGHAVGDLVLVEVAARLRALVGAAGLVARLGGDEFVVAATSPVSAVSKLLAYEAARAVARPVDVPGGPVLVSASVGVVHALPGDDPVRLLHSADTAMYRAKTGDPGTSVVEYDPAQPLMPAPEHRPAVRLRDMTGTARDLVPGVAW